MKFKLKSYGKKFEFEIVFKVKRKKPPIIKNETKYLVLFSNKEITSGNKTIINIK